MELTREIRKNRSPFNLFKTSPSLHLISFQHPLSLPFYVFIPGWVSFYLFGFVPTRTHLRILHQVILLVHSFLSLWFSYYTGDISSKRKSYSKFQLRIFRRSLIFMGKNLWHSPNTPTYQILDSSIQRDLRSYHRFVFDVFIFGFNLL